MYYAGIDVGKRKHAVQVLDSDGNDVGKAYSITNDFEGFSETCSHDEAIQFVEILFAIATADGQASIPEIEENRKIAGSLKLFHNKCVDAKMRAPRDLRAG